MEPEKSVMTQGPRLLPRRNRAALACNACRKVKSKCDGARPSCSRCSRQNIECAYTLNVHDRRMDRQEERRAHLALKHKVTELEARLAAASSPDRLTAEDPEDMLSPAQASNGGLSDTGSRGTNAGSAVDALATGAFDYRPAAEIGYFGPTSNHAMFRSVTTAMVNSGYRLTVLHQQENDRQLLQPTANNQSRPVPFTEAPSSLSRPRSNEHYPSQPVARQWVTLFFDTVGSVLPYVNETTLLREIDSAGPCIESGRITPRSLEGLLNIVFAHALVAAGKENVAEPFYHRAVALLLLEEQAVSTPTMHTVQALLLLGSFQQNTQRAMASLASHSLAVKASYQLGLHSPSTYDGLSTSDKELRAKLWFAVVNQDMILGTALGRPCLIPPNYVQYRMLDSVAPEIMNAAGLSLPSSTENVYYFRYLSSLHQIMGNAVDSIYGSNIGSLYELEPKELVSSTMELLFKLQTWQNSIRPFSILGSKSEFGLWPAPKFQADRYSILLSVYYYKTIMLVCAPLLMRVLEQVTDSTSANDTSFGGMLLEMSAPVLKRELHSISEYQRIANGVLRHQPSFFKSNAIWWVCNFNSLTMSLHLFAMWLVCILSESMPAAINNTVSGVEALLLEATDILKSVGGTSLMSVKAYHSLQRYMRLARAIVPNNYKVPSGSTGPVNLEELLHESQQSSLFTSGAFLWDGFPDASMNYVGDLFYQQIESGFLGESSVGVQPGTADFDTTGIPLDRSMS